MARLAEVISGKDILQNTLLIRDQDESNTMCEVFGGLLTIKEEKKGRLNAVERAGEEVEMLRRGNLITWHQEVRKIRQELCEMERALDESLVSQEGKLRAKVLQRRNRLPKLPQISEAELQALPVTMRPKPKKAPPEAKHLRENRAGINSKSFEILRIKLSGDVIRPIRTSSARNEAVLAPIGADDAQPRSMTTREGAPNEHTSQRGGRKSPNQVSNLLSKDLLMQYRNSTSIDFGRRTLESKDHRRDMIDSYKQQLSRNKEGNHDRDRYWGLGDVGRGRTMLHVKMPDIIIQEERGGKAGQAQQQRKLVKLQRESLELAARHSEEVKAAMIKARDAMRDSILEETEASNTAVVGEASVEPLNHRAAGDGKYDTTRPEADCEVVPYFATRVYADVAGDSGEQIGGDDIRPGIAHGDAPDRADYREYKHQVKEVSMDEVKASRLIRGYEPDVMKIDADINDFVFNN